MVGTRRVVRASGGAVAAIALAMALGGCASGSPRVKVVGAGVREVGEAGTVLGFLLECENPGEDALPLRTADYTVWLDGRRVFEGQRRAQATLRRFGTQEIVLPAAVAHAGGELAGTHEYRIEGTLTYLAPGALAQVLFDADLVKPSRSFAGEGTLEVGAPAGK